VPARPLIVIESHDEPQVMNLFGELRRQLSRPLFKWTAAQGLSWVERDQNLAAEFKPSLTMRSTIFAPAIVASTCCWISTPILTDPVIVRLLARNEPSRTMEACAHRGAGQPRAEAAAELDAVARRFKLHRPIAPY
jgi:hypothetical protein